MTGIVGYGAWIPYLRISVDEIYRAWRDQDIRHIKEGLRLSERAVLQPNEDTITLSVGAAERALEHASVEPPTIGAAFLGTCTNPYDSRPSVTVLPKRSGFDTAFSPVTLSSPGSLAQPPSRLAWGSSLATWRRVRFASVPHNEPPCVPRPGSRICGLGRSRRRCPRQPQHDCRHHVHDLLRVGSVRCVSCRGRALHSRHRRGR